MEPAQKCSVGIPDARYHNDILHPCVRYVAEGFGGHQWWMVQSPHYGRDDSIENPILFFGDTEPDGTPPLTWYFADVVKDSPETGYNSDPNLYFADDRLYVLWREFRTGRVINAGYNSAIYAMAYDTFLQKQQEVFVCGTPASSPYDLVDLSPIVTVHDGSISLYTLYFRRESSLIKRAVAKILQMVGCKYSVHKTVGINRLSGASLRDMDAAPKLLHFTNIGWRRPWHFDIIMFNGQMFLLVFCQMRQNIYLAASDGDGFRMFDRPLLPPRMLVDTYKPTGAVIGNNLYLYYTDKTDKDDPKHNELFRYCIDLRDYMEKIRD